MLVDNPSKHTVLAVLNTIKNIKATYKTASEGKVTKHDDLRSISLWALLGERAN